MAKPALDASLILDAPALRAERERVTRFVLGAAKGAIADNTRDLEKDLEELTRRTVPGRLWRAWASEVFPRGAALAREPVGVVFVKGGDRSQGAMAFFSRPGRIKPKDGAILWIPLPAAGSRGRRRDLTPEEWERRTGQKLRLVQRSGHPPLLVLDEGVLSGKRQVARKNTARRIAAGRGNATIPIFVGVPYVDFANKFAAEPLVRRRGARIAPDFVERVNAGS
ncbi:MAG: hypothetical protein QOH86_1169 [Sphingomonadales bacterium]|nr:hypothetical protein [Sphingomonadales bacterium]